MRIILFLLILCLCGLVGYAVNLIPLRVTYRLAATLACRQRRPLPHPESTLLALAQPTNL